MCVKCKEQSFQQMPDMYVLLIVCVCLSEKCASALVVVVGVYVCLRKRTIYFLRFFCDLRSFLCKRLRRYCVVGVFALAIYVCILCSLCKFNSPIICELFVMGRHYCVARVGLECQATAVYSQLCNLIERTIAKQVKYGRNVAASQLINYKYHFNDESS